MPRGTANPELTSSVSKKANQPVHMKHYQSEQQSIIRQSCLKSAVAFVTPFAGKITLTDANGEPSAASLVYYQKLVLETAEIFEAFVNRPHEAEASQD
jgi:hypothetical protein